MRLIDANEVRKKAIPHTRGEHGYSADIRKWAVLVGEIDDAPTIEAEPVKHGRWWKGVESKLDTHTGEYWEEVYYNCLECDYASDWNSPYCPNCGATMDLQGED